MGRLAKKVREARVEAGLTQGELAELLGRSQTLVSLVENGMVRIGRRYVNRVLKACGVPAAEAPARGGTKEGYVVGIDPQTCELVRRGTKRDLELTEKYVWW